MGLNEKVFVNRTLNLKKITHIGLDMDHTLIRYNTKNFEALAHKTMLQKLVDDLDYPPSILGLKFDFNRAIRGLVIDKSHGNILKLSRHAAIRGSYHGLNRIDYKTQKQLYKSTYIDLGDNNYDSIDTGFSIAFASLFAQLVDLKDANKFAAAIDYSKIASDLGLVLDLAHRDGSIKDIVRENLSSYIELDEELIQGLERFAKHGKKLFIVTNSDYKYSKLLLDYAVNPFLKSHDSWSKLFDITVTLAQKPRFFYDNLAFFKVNPKDGTLTNVEGKIGNGIYQGGCATKLTDDLDLEPDQILYIGDHIYGDIVRLKKDCAWRTALVVEEIGAEIKQNQAVEEIQNKISKLMGDKIPMEVKIDDLISERIDKNIKAPSHNSEVTALIERVSVIDKKISGFIQEAQKEYNPYWGEVMRTGIEESYFAYQVERFACVYMSKLSNLFWLSPRTYFRTTKSPMPHDL